MRAIVFVRRSGARGAGHVGWAFDAGDGTFGVGSIENPRHSLRTAPQLMGFWAVRTADPLSPMRWRAYTEYKLLEIDPAWPAFAWQVVAWLSHRPYEVFYHNCMNATYDVLRAFGARDLPAPAHHWEPNHWFDHVRGPAFALEANGATALARQIARPVAALGLGVAGGWSSGVSARITPAPPGWRIPDTPEWHELQRAIAAAPPMPGRQPGRAKCARAMITRLRRLFGT